MMRLCVRKGKNNKNNIGGCFKNRWSSKREEKKQKNKSTKNN